MEVITKQEMLEKKVQALVEIISLLGIKFSPFKNLQDKLEFAQGSLMEKIIEVNRLYLDETFPQQWRQRSSNDEEV